MYKRTILGYLLDYLKLKEIEYKTSGKITMLKCPLCKSDKLTATIIPNTNLVNCFSCKTKYNLIDIVRIIENKKDMVEEDILQYLKELFNIDVTTPKDQKELEEILNFYQEQGFDLVPIAKNAKNPIEKDWTNKSHKNKEEWKDWIINAGLNIGIKGGKISDVTILDIDQKPIPEEIKNRLRDDNTFVQESSRGFHYFFKYEPELPKTRIEELKTDIETDGGQVVIYPSSINGIKRKIIQMGKITQMPEELKQFLKEKVTVPRKTQSELLIEDIQTGDFKIDPNKFLLKNENLAGCCNSEFIKLGGILRKELNNNQTAYVLKVLNRHLLERPMDERAINAMIGSLDRYIQDDTQDLAHKIVDYLKVAESATKAEIEIAISGERARGENKKRLDKVLTYLIKEGYILKKGRFYQSIKKAEWKENLIDASKPIDFKMPYFYDIANFNYGDLLLIGSKTKKGKSSIALNIIKQLAEQGIKPYYINLEPGNRFAKIALQLGLKEGDFKWDFVADPTQIELEKNAVTIIDWLLIREKNKTDLVFEHLIKQLNKMGGFLIVFQQLKKDNEFFAPNLCTQFPAFACKYVYEDENDGTYGQFKIDVIRDPKSNIKSYEIPCIYDWHNKILKRLDEKDEILKENK